MTDVTNHIASGKPSVLTYRMPLDDTTELGDDSYDQSWHRVTLECDDKAKSAYLVAHGFKGQCDEYPFYSTVEGGPYNYGPPNNWVSLRLVTPLHNARQGGTIRAFLTRCNVYKNQQFKVRAQTDAVTAGFDKDGQQCY